MNKPVVLYLHKWIIHSLHGNRSCCLYVYQGLFKWYFMVEFHDRGLRLLFCFICCNKSDYLFSCTLWVAHSERTQGASAYYHHYISPFNKQYHLVLRTTILKCNLRICDSLFSTVPVTCLKLWIERWWKQGNCPKSEEYNRYSECIKYQPFVNIRN